MKNKIIIVSILFNINPGWKNNPHAKTRLTEEWINYRMSIFMNYTCASLKNQTNQDFIALIAYDPATEDLINNSLSQYDKLPDNIIFTPNIYKDTIKLINDYEYLYQVRLDSDNMYHPRFIQQLHDFKPKEETEAIINQKGYVYHVESNGLGTFYHESPSFFTFILKVSDFKKGIYPKVQGGHLGVIKLNHEILDYDNFMIIIHEQNVSNKFIKGMYKELIQDKAEKENILKEFKMI